MGLAIKLNKCKFLHESVRYLSLIFNKEGLRPDSTNLKAITSSPTRENISQLKSFLGIMNYYGNIIPNLSDLLTHYITINKKRNIEVGTYLGVFFHVSVYRPNS